MNAPTIPRHILIANNIYPPIMAGGAELIVAYLAEGLVRKGHRVTVVSTCGPEMEPYPVETRNGVEVIRFFPKNVYWSWTRGDRPGYQKALWHLRDAWNRDAAKRFRTILQETTPDLLHTHLIDGMSAALWRRAQQAGMPVLHTAHDYHLLCPRSLMLTKSLNICNNPQLGCRLYRRWHLATAKDVDLFCSPSSFLIEKHKEAGLSGATAVVRNGIPLPQIPPRVFAPKAKRRFLFAARLTIEKGCQVVLDAIGKLPKDMDFELCVAGKGPFEEAFRNLAERDARVRFLGYISGEAKSEIFQSADCLVIPSLWYENAPVVIVEAAAYGMGVIGSNIGAIPEFVKHEQTGLLFEPGNAASLAAAITRVVKEEGLLPHFAEQAKQLVASSSVEQMVSAYSAQYEQLLAQKSQTRNAA